MTLSNPAEAKRFLEIWLAEPDFRRTVGVEQVADAQALTAGLTEERRVQRERLLHDNAPGHPGWRSWRQRQMQRCSRELEVNTAAAILHVPLAVELSSGCSVGCWFCGLSAASLKGHFLATTDNLLLGRQVLDIFGRLRQGGARGGLLYWATDPLDNPDYEIWCREFHARLGHFPHTTTALALRDPARTRAFLQLAAGYEDSAVRFSVLSRGQLRKIHAQFSPQELEKVDLLLQLDQGPVVKAGAGRALGEGASDATIACVSGFLLNLLERRLQWISPCAADQRWPQGYRVHAEGHFQDAREFEAVLRGMLDQMQERLPLEQPLRWRRGREPEGVWEVLCGRLDHGPTALELARRLEEEHSIEMSESLYRLNQFFRLGYFEDEMEVVALVRS